MKLIELHILQSFPVSCLNRDDLGAPKSAVFGGVTRARISSQCLKRAIRMQAKELCPELFKGDRSRLIVKPIAEAAKAAGLPEDKALEAAREFCDALAKYDSETEKKKGVQQVKTLMYLSPSEIQGAGALVAQQKQKAAEGKRSKSQAEKFQPKLTDAADIALFGRMAASDHSLTLEGAAMFGHALSTHRADNDIDFYTAVDDRQQGDASIADEDRAGSGMMGTLEFTSATYYRYMGLNVDLLHDAKHLQQLSPENLKKVVDAFLRACLMAVPNARKNSMNGNTLPGYVLGIARETGHPLQLINAFEKPVRPKGEGLLAPSIEKLQTHLQELKEKWGISIAAEVAIPDKDLNGFCETLLKYV